MQTISINEKSLVTFSTGTQNVNHYINRLEELGIKYSKIIGKNTSTFTIEADFNKYFLTQLNDLFN